MPKITISFEIVFNYGKIFLSTLNQSHDFDTTSTLLLHQCKTWKRLHYTNQRVSHIIYTNKYRMNESETFPRKSYLIFLKAYSDDKV